MTHRTTSDSLRGRRLRQAKGSKLADDSALTPEQLEWNAEVERRKALKKARDFKPFTLPKVSA